MNKYEIRYFPTPIQGYHYLGVELTSIDGGKTYYHTGNGRYFHTHEEADRWVKMMESEE